jgi:hypothetical protein
MPMNGYHVAVIADHSQEPPFDPRWLDVLTELCRAASRGRPSLVDLYLERRLESRLIQSADGVAAEECRSEGVAARWRESGRMSLEAATGVGPRSLASLLGRRIEIGALIAGRRLPPPELDTPRGWRDFAEEQLDQLGTPGSELVYLERRAVVVRPEGWTVTGGPSLLRAVAAGSRSRAMLAVWNHPMIRRWMRALADPEPERTWAPDPGLRLPVLLARGTAGVVLHEVIGHLTEGDLVAAGGSPLGTLTGAVITTPSLSVLDDPTRFDLPGGFSHDDEGVPASPSRSVDEGRLSGWLCDRASAALLDAQPGRGRRASWDTPPVARLTNLVVGPGSTPLADLESGLDRGLVVTRVGNATVDPASRRLVLRVERGFEVRGGRRRRALARCELTGDALEVLATIDPAIGDDPTPDWRLGWCVKDGRPLPTGSECPSLVVRGLEVL